MVAESAREQGAEFAAGLWADEDESEGEAASETAGEAEPASPFAAKLDTLELVRSGDVLVPKSTVGRQAEADTSAGAMDVELVETTQRWDTADLARLSSAGAGGGEVGAVEPEAAARSGAGEGSRRQLPRSLRHAKKIIKTSAKGAGDPNAATQATLEQARAEIARLHAELAEAAARAETTQPPLGDSAEHLALRSERDELARKAAQHTTAQQAQRARLSQLEADLEETLDALRREVDSHAQTRRTVADLETQLARSQSDLEARRVRLLEMEETLGRTRRDLAHLQAAQETWDAATQQAARDAASRVYPERAPETLASLSRSLAALEATLTDRDSLQNDARNARHHLDTARRCSATIDDALDTLEHLLTPRESTLLEALEETERAEQRLMSGRANLQALPSLVERLHKRLSGISAAVRELQGELGGLAGAMADQQMSMDGQVDAAIHSRRSLEDQVADLASVRAALTAMRDDHAQLAASLDAATESEELLQGEVARRDAVIWERVSSIRTLRTTLSSESPAPATPAGRARTAPEPALADPVTSTEPRMRSFDRLAYDRLHDADLSPSARIQLLEPAVPTRESARLTNSMGVSPKAAFLVSLIDGTVTLGDLIDLSGLPREEAAGLLVDLVLGGHLQLPQLEVKRDR